MCEGSTPEQVIDDTYPKENSKAICNKVSWDDRFFYVVELKGTDIRFRYHQENSALELLDILGLAELFTGKTGTEFVPYET